MYTQVHPEMTTGLHSRCALLGAGTLLYLYMCSTSYQWARIPPYPPEPKILSINQKFKVCVSKQKQSRGLPGPSLTMN